MTRKKPAKTKRQSNQPASESEILRPDPTFKNIIGQAAVAMGLELRNVEIPQISITDLIIGVPDKTKLPETMFDFFNDVNFVEFKSEGDHFTDIELADNLGRVYLFYAKDGTVEFEQILSVFVCSHYPQDLVDWLVTKNVTPIETGQEWRLHYRIGLININILVCRLLPLEERYYQFLLFAPASSPKWKEFVKIAIENELKDLVNLVTRLKPMEVSMIIEERKRDKKLTPTQADIYKQAALNVWEFIKTLPGEQQLDFVLKVFPMGNLVDLMNSEQLDQLIKLAEERKKQEGDDN